MTVNAQLSTDTTSSVVQTTDGTTSTTIYSASAFLANDGGQVVTFDVCGFDFVNNDVASAKIVVKLKNISGTPTIIGTPIHLVPINAGSSAGLATASVNVVISGSNIKVNVIGVEGRTIDWTANRISTLSVLDPWTAVPTPADGYALVWSASRSRWEPTPLISGTVGEGYVIAWNGSEWQPTPLSGISNTMSGDANGALGSNLIYQISGNDGTVALGASAGAGLILSGVAKTTDAPTGTIQILGSEAYASATGANLNGGQVVIKGGEGKSSGRGGAVYIQGGVGVGGPGVGDGYIYIGNSASDYIIIRDSYSNYLEFLSSTVNLVKSGGGSVQLSTGGASIAGATVILNGELSLPAISTSSASGLAGYIVVNINGTSRRIPYYSA